jgi:hypothetical protein
MAERLQPDRQRCCRYLLVVATSTAVSRALGVSQSWSASLNSRLVSPAIAETTTIRSSPLARARATRSATALIRSIEPTEVPPYFWTIRVTGLLNITPERGVIGNYAGKGADKRAPTGTPARLVNAEMPIAIT